jgi:hypothetical protein
VKYVENAIEALMNGQEVGEENTKAIGCTIKRAKGLKFFFSEKALGKALLGKSLIRSGSVINVPGNAIITKVGIVLKYRSIALSLFFVLPGSACLYWPLTTTALILCFLSTPVPQLSCFLPPCFNFLLK